MIMTEKQKKRKKRAKISREKKKTENKIKLGETLKNGARKKRESVPVGTRMGLGFLNWPIASNGEN